MFGSSNTTGVSAGKDAMPVVPVIGPPIEYNARDPVTDPARATGPDQIISPQMLIKYFPAMTDGGTNAARMGVVTPFGFTPPTVVTPTPAAAPSSKAANPTSP
jgi:hypothetical protein